METEILNKSPKLYDLKSAIASDVLLFNTSVENFRNQVLKSIQEGYEFKLPSQKEYGNIRPVPIERTTVNGPATEKGYEFLILINEWTYALQFTVNEEGRVSIVLLADGRVKSNNGPFWCHTFFSKIDDGAKYDEFMEKIYTWMTAEEAYGLLGMIIEYVDVTEIRE